MLLKTLAQRGNLTARIGIEPAFEAGARQPSPLVSPLGGSGKLIERIVRAYFLDYLG